MALGRPRRDGDQNPTSADTSAHPGEPGVGVDLAPPFLEVLAWGEHPSRFEWFERPGEEMSEVALELLERLGACTAGRVTELGRRLRQTDP